MEALKATMEALRKEEGGARGQALALRPSPHTCLSRDLWKMAGSKFYNVQCGLLSQAASSTPPKLVKALRKNDEQKGTKD